MRVTAYALWYRLVGRGAVARVSFREPRQLVRWLALMRRDVDVLRLSEYVTHEPAPHEAHESEVHV